MACPIVKFRSTLEKCDPQTFGGPPPPLNRKILRALLISHLLKWGTMISVIYFDFLQGYRKLGCTFWRAIKGYEFSILKFLIMFNLGLTICRFNRKILVENKTFKITLRITIPYLNQLACIVNKHNSLNINNFRNFKIICKIVCSVQNQWICIYLWVDVYFIVISYSNKTWLQEYEPIINVDDSWKAKLCEV